VNGTLIEAAPFFTGIASDWVVFLNHKFPPRVTLEQENTNKNRMKVAGLEKLLAILLGGKKITKITEQIKGEIPSDLVARKELGHCLDVQRET